MSKLKATTEEDILQSLEELEQLVKNKLDRPHHSHETTDVEPKLVELEKKFQSINEKNSKIHDILTKVIAELESLLTHDETKCQ